MFIGNSQKESRYLSSPVYRCCLWWIQNWLQFEQHYSDSASSISSVKNSPAINAIKISAVILNLASDKPESDKPEKINISLLLILTVTYEHCVTIKQTVIRAGRRVYKKIQGSWGSRETLIFSCFSKLYLFLFPVLIKVSVLLSVVN